jgi:phenylalanyl-tRNA synthetase alpha subunit
MTEPKEWFEKYWKSPDTEVQKARKELLANERWFEEHFEEFKVKYPRKLLAIYNKEVKFVADSEEELAKLVQESGLPEDAVVKTYVETEPIYEIMFMGPPRVKPPSSLW